MAKRMKCPHCGNASPSTIDSNGCRPSDPNYTLLCVAQVKPEDAAILPYGFDPDTDTDPHGLVPCGQQWCPDDETTRCT